MRPGGGGGDYDRRGGGPPPFGRNRGGGSGGGGGWRGGRGGGGRGGPPFRGRGGGPPPQLGVGSGGAAAPPAGAGGPRVLVDRTKTCPLLLRVFIKQGAHHRIEDFTARGGKEPDGAVHVYTWPDATLAELGELVREVSEPARRPRTRLSFAFVYPDRRGVNVMRQVGMVVVGRPGGGDDDRALAELGFETGDSLDVAVLPP